MRRREKSGTTRAVPPNTPGNKRTNKASRATCAETPRGLSRTNRLSVGLVDGGGGKGGGEEKKEEAAAAAHGPGARTSQQAKMLLKEYRICMPLTVEEVSGAAPQVPVRLNECQE